MWAVIMAGGRAERLWGMPKPLIKVCGKPVIDRVISAAREAVGDVAVAVTPLTYAVGKRALALGAQVLVTEGLGYSLDLAEVMRVLGPPFITLPADTPFITPETITDFINAAAREDTDVVTLLVSYDCFPGRVGRVPSPVGISLIKGRGPEYSNIVMCRYPDLLDIDTFSDLKEAEELCGA